MEPLYRLGYTPSRGELIMIAGRSGAQKSGFALWWTAQMNLPTLYFSADMSAYQASIRLACSLLHMTTEQVEARYKRPEGRAEILAALSPLNLNFSFGAITWQGVTDEITAYVELFNEFPQVIVVDNLMDIEGTDSDYTMQMEAMQNLSDLSRSTGATVIVLHHASDKSQDASSDPFNPPARKEIKNGMSEKPESVLTVALNPHSHLFQVAVTKNRMGAQDPTGRTTAKFRARPAETRFEKWVEPTTQGFAQVY